MIHLSNLNKWVWILIFFSCAASGQVALETQAPDLKTESAVDSYGVDLIGGEPLISGVNLSIGPAHNGIKINDSSFNGMRNTYVGYVTYMQSLGREGGCSMLKSGRFFEVSTGSERAVFEYVSNNEKQTLIRGRGAFKHKSISFVYIDQNGTEYNFDKLTGAETVPAVEPDIGTVGCVARKTMARLSKVTKSDGEILDIAYLNLEPVVLPGGATYTPAFFTSVKSSLGWMFKTERVFLNKTTTSSTSKRSSYFVNLSVDHCSPNASTSCANISNAWPKFDLTQSSSESGQVPSKNTVFSGVLTNPLGKATSLTYDYTQSRLSYDTVHTSPEGIVTTYKKSCPDSFCNDTSQYRLSSIARGSVTLGGYGNRSMEPSGYANHSLVMNEASGPYGKVRYVPVNSGYPFYFIDNLSRTTENTYLTNTTWSLEKVGIVNDSKTVASYDSRGNITSITQQPKVAGTTPLVTSFVYPAESTCTSSPKICNKPSSVTESNGVTTTYSYHAQSGYVETVTKPAVNNVQAQTRYKYEQKNPYVKNSSGNLVANPAVWVLTEVSECMTATLNTCVNTADEKRTIYSNFTNNLLAQKTTVQNGTGAIKLEILTEYDIYGNVVAVDGPRSGTDDKVFYFYDLMRQKVGEIGVDPDGNGPLPRQAVKTVYNDDGKVVSVNSGVTFGTSKADLDSMTVKQQSATEYSTDHGLPTVERFYAAGVLEKVTQKSYDNKLRLECVAQRLNRNAWSSLPSSSCTLGIAGPEGNDRITKYTYDLAGAVLTTISAFGTPLQRTDRTNKYSAVNGSLISESDAKGNLTSYKYDDFNRLFKTVYPNPANGTAESATDYTQTNYKSGSSLVNSVRLRDGLTVNFSEYDALGRVKTKSGALSESFTYNNFNQVLTHTNNSTGGVSQTSIYVFNSLGWLKSEARVAGGVSLGSVSYGHDGIGRRTSLTWPDNFSIKYDYNVNNTPSEYLRKITESNGTLLAQFDYYDNGLRKSLTRGNGVVTNYAYNNLYQLKTQSTDVGGSSTTDDISETFTYTQAGQLKTHLLNVANNNYRYTPSAAAAINYVPDALSRISTLNGAAFTYDGRGNLTKDNTGTTYTYNANNLLLNSTKGGVATTLSYDAENRLFSVIKSGATTKFMYDGTDLIAETNASNVIQRRYVHGPETDDPIVWYEGSGTTDKRYYTANRQGSIVGVTLQNGLSTSVNAYDEYGIQKLSTIGRFQYTGQTWIPEVGLYYYKARFYSPSLGRFMQTDPIGYKDGMNWYAYVGNDPINKNDPTGLSQCGSTLPGGKIYQCDDAAKKVSDREQAFRDLGMDDPSRGMIDGAKKTGDGAAEAGNLIEDIATPTPTAKVGLAAVIGAKLAKSIKVFGHTFNTHGMKNTKSLTDRAKGTGTPQGQWADDGKAADFLINVKVDGPATIPIPEGLGRVIMPDGTIINAQHAVVVPSMFGFRTAYPFVP